jgi:hypothetical protein
MRSHGSVALALLALVAIAMAGCASTKVTDRQALVTEKIARPERILVYDFAATPAEVSEHSALAGQHDEPSTPPTPEQIQAGRELGVQIARELAANIDAMGLRAEAVPIGTAPQVGNLVIKGHLVSVDAGSAQKRVVIGFGSGASELKTVVEGFQMTPQGLRKLGGGSVDAGGGKSPGGALGVVGLVAAGNPAGLIVSSGMKVYGEASGSSKLEGRAKATAKEIADQLRPRFQEQGWIQ